uniref:Uncharacterized protein n=1 Tax=Neospora caninum (strain Liverpool) TaxID=572307 RepID=A0A0F7UGD2_NEOCL|nr:TPA: hypothetical protein BN1204_048220 [Neospora caninum Liverpool]
MGSSMGRQHSAGCLPVKHWLTRIRDHERHGHSPLQIEKQERPIPRTDADYCTREPLNFFLRMDPDFFYAVTSCLFLDELPRLCEVSRRFRALVCDGNCAERSLGLRLSDGLLRYLFEVDRERQFLLRNSQSGEIDEAYPELGGHTAALIPHGPPDGATISGTPGPHTANSSSRNSRAVVRGKTRQSERSLGDGLSGGAADLIPDGGGAPRQTKSDVVPNPHKTAGSAGERSTGVQSSWIQERWSPVPAIASPGLIIPREERKPIMEGLLQQMLATTPHMRVLVVNCKESIPLTDLLVQTLMSQFRAIEVCHLVNSEGDVHTILAELIPKATQLKELYIGSMLGWTDHEMSLVLASLFSSSPSRLSSIAISSGAALLLKGAEIAKTTREAGTLRSSDRTAFYSVRRIHFVPDGLFFRGRLSVIVSELNKLCSFFPNCDLSLDGMIVLQIPTRRPRDGDVDEAGSNDDELLFDALFKPGKVFRSLGDESSSIFHISRLAACDFIANGVSEEACFQFSAAQRFIVQHYEGLLKLQNPVLPSLGVLAPPNWLASYAGAVFRNRFQILFDRLEACVFVLPADYSGSLEALYEESLGILRERRHKIRGVEIRRTPTTLPERATPAMMDLMISNMFQDSPMALRIVRITCRTRLEVHRNFIAEIMGLVKQTPSLDVVEVSIGRSNSEAETFQYQRDFCTARHDLRETFSKAGFYDREVTTDRCDVLLFFRQTRIPTGAHKWKFPRKGYGLTRSSQVRGSSPPSGELIHPDRKRLLHTSDCKRNVSSPFSGRSLKPDAKYSESSGGHD